MGLQNLYYYSWYPEVSTSANTESTMSADCLSSWTARLPGKKWIGWLLLVAVIILTCIVAYNVFSPSSSGQVTAGQQKQGESGLASSSEDLTTRNTSDVSCPAGHMKCALTGNCLPLLLYCNGVNDCGEGDLSDEPIDKAECSCLHYLRTHNPERICDPTGVCHCPDRSDCLACSCPENFFNCNAGSNSSIDCIPRHRVCDGEVDCHQSGLDEETCISLASKNTEMPFSSMTSALTAEGYVLVQLSGIWHPYCSNSWNDYLYHNICSRIQLPSVVDSKLMGLKEFDRQWNTESHVVADHLQLLVVRNETDLTPGNLNIIDVEEEQIIENDWYTCKLAYLKCEQQRVVENFENQSV